MSLRNRRKGERVPNRIIRESCLTSPTLAQLSDGAERLFWRLTVVADDYGRFLADAEVVRGACFSRLPSAFTVRRIDQLLAELAQARDPLIRLYQIGDRRYGVFLAWDKYNRRRAQHAKYPSPTDDNICQQMPADASTCVVSREARSEKREARHEKAAPSPDGFDQFWTHYPRKVAKTRAQRAWTKLAPSEHLTATILAAVSAATTSESWRRDHGQWIPHPATWLNDRRWEDTVEPVDGKSAAARALEARILHGPG